MSNSAKLQAFATQLQSQGSISTADLVSALELILQAFDSLPAGTDPIQYFKKPGAWEDTPLTVVDPTTPVWVSLPCLIEFENVPPGQLSGLTAQQAGFNATVTVGVGSVTPTP